MSPLCGLTNAGRDKLCPYGWLMLSDRGICQLKMAAPNAEYEIDIFDYHML